ncbi:MAG: threonylcarbamoyl-AMP synthase [Actinobacteria bacterium]|uniref:Threonylcarbamoyl-AMP synthase n=1 Tax=freshwater metagenome TaxID=449393 RepID=A0A6J7U4E1_9ZZZZ|nr:threonylcarbamoyl-AMP synthase [Actinomycetota bacterium]
MADAAARLLAGNLVAFPTETVYGLGADACNGQAVKRIYEVKGRPTDHPLIVHIASMDSMGDWASDINEYAIALARDFWPGPMTLIVKRSELAADFITGGQDTVGIRVPDHALALGLLEDAQKMGIKGIAAPSANRFGQVSPTTAAAVIEELGEYLHADDLVLDGGACTVGVESTIIDCTGDIPRILRPGAISDEMIAHSTGLEVIRTYRFIDDGAGIVWINKVEDVRVSGSLENHYSPAAKVYLDQPPQSGQGFIALADIPTPDGVIRLAAPSNNEEFARMLYVALREADLQGLSEVVVMQPIGPGIAVAICDRLVRAANGR